MNATHSNRPSAKVHRLVLLVYALLASAAVSTAVAHHSTAVYDDDKTVTLTGKVSRVLWANPHTFFDMVVTTKGKPVTWTIIYGTPTMLVRNGWRKEDLKIGDKVAATVHPDRTGKPGGILLHITLADGRELEGVREFLGIEPKSPKSP